MIANMYIIYQPCCNYNRVHKGGDSVEGFKIDTRDEKISSISRTIRMKTETFDKINEINMKTGVSFNKIVNQCIEYALKNYEE